MDLLTFGIAGFTAQAVDGALGMAYGVTCTSLLLAFGYSPVAASASVHMAEIVTSGVSGHFHRRFGNVNSTLFRNLAGPGMIGGAVGAYVLASMPADAIKPVVAMYLGLMGLRILIRAWVGPRPKLIAAPRIGMLGFTGGLPDAMGGGWGPIVTSTLGCGHDPRTAIGSVNRAEFFVTVVQSATFIFTIGLGNWRVVAGLCLGGAMAAPLAAVMARRLEAEHLMVAVGCLIVLVSLQTLASRYDRSFREERCGRARATPSVPPTCARPVFSECVERRPIGNTTASRRRSVLINFESTTNF